MFVAMAMVACGRAPVDGEETEQPPVVVGGTVAGTWFYQWEVVNLPTLRGTLTVEQNGTQVTGVLGLPVDYPPGLILPEYWDWRLSGTVTSGQITAGPGCQCASPPPFNLTCRLGSRSLGCDVTQGDEYGDHSGTFQASR